jgi:hypothetical protein
MSLWVKGAVLTLDPPLRYRHVRGQRPVRPDPHYHGPTRRNGSRCHCGAIALVGLRSMAEKDDPSKATIFGADDGRSLR